MSDQREHEWLGYACDGKWLADTGNFVDGTVAANGCDAEEIGVDPGQRRIKLRHGAIAGAGMAGMKR